jgi:hypothetical protein
MEKEERWVDIVGYEGLYRLSSFGNIFSYRTNKIKKHVLVGGYPVIGLNKPVIGQKIKRVHRLLAEHFLPPPDSPEKNCVHHINHDKADFRLENLMWVTNSENCQSEYDDGCRIGKTQMKGKFGFLNPGSIIIKRIDRLGKSELIYGISEAARMVNGSASHIVKVCKGKLKHHKGYKWEYA